MIDDYFSIRFAIPLLLDDHCFVSGFSLFDHGSSISFFSITIRRGAYCYASTRWTHSNANANFFGTGWSGGH
jgi:hypothetical protein